MIPKEDGFLVLKGYWEPPLCLGNKALQCREGRSLETTGCVDTLLGMASWPSEDHSLQTAIPPVSEKPNILFPVSEISPSSQGTPKQVQSNSFIACNICGCSEVADLCGYTIKGVLFPWLMLSSLIPNATAEIRSMIHTYLFSGSCHRDG